MASRIRIAFKRRGNVVVFAAVLIVALMAMCAFALDIGFVTTRRTELQAAVDGAALAAVDQLQDGIVMIQQTVDSVLADNGFNPATETGFTRTLTFGDWDTDTRTFTVVANPDNANAVRVEVVHSKIPAFFGKVFGKSYTQIETRAIATRDGKPRDVVMVLDCSTSMSSSMGNGQSRIANTRAAAQALIDQLSASDRLGLAVYSWRDNSRDDYDKTGRVEHHLQLNKNPVSNKVSNLNSGHYTSGTNIGGGFRAGLDIFLNSPGRNPMPPYGVDKVLVMMTDGLVNMAEPYPAPNDGPNGVLPPPPYKKSNYDDRDAVRKWANTIKARGISVYVITLGTSAHDSLMVNAATPDDADGNTFYYHIKDGSDDHVQLFQAFQGIGRGNRHPRLVD